MAESISSVRANETRDSASETQSDCDRCTGQASNDEDNNFAVKQDGKKISPEQTTSPNRKRGRNESEEDETNEELKRNERRAANRLSAFQSRQRRKSIIADLQVRRIRISVENLPAFNTHRLLAIFLQSRKLLPNSRKTVMINERRIARGRLSWKHCVRKTKCSALKLMDFEVMRCNQHLTHRK